MHIRGEIKIQCFKTEVFSALQLRVGGHQTGFEVVSKVKVKIKPYRW